MDKKTTDVKWWWYLACNQRKNWREDMGMVMRNIADLIDGRRSLAIYMRSNPELPTKAHENIVVMGVKHMQVLLCESARLEAIEPVYREIRPDLFEKKEEA